MKTLHLIVFMSLNSVFLVFVVQLYFYYYIYTKIEYTSKLCNKYNSIFNVLPHCFAIRYAKSDDLLRLKKIFDTLSLLYTNFENQTSFNKGLNSIISVLSTFSKSKNI